MVGVEVPPERDRLALKDDHGGVCDAHDSGDDHDETNDPDVQWDNGDAQQEEAHGDFQHTCRQRVEYLAEVPEVEGRLSARICELLTGDAGSMG